MLHFTRLVALLFRITLMALATFGLGCYLLAGIGIIFQEQTNFVNWLADGNMNDAIIWGCATFGSAAWLYMEHYNSNHFMMPIEREGVVFHKVLSRNSYCEHLKTIAKFKGDHLLEREMIIVSKEQLLKLDAKPCIHCFVFNS